MPTSANRHLLRLLRYLSTSKTYHVKVIAQGMIRELVIIRMESASSQKILYKGHHIFLNVVNKELAIHNIQLLLKKANPFSFSP